jgi:hypothetical protein
MSDLAPLLQKFFTDKLERHMNASVRTKAAYADTFRLLLLYAQRATGAAPSELTLADLNADLAGGFLQHLETDRGNSVATRNARRAALRSFFTYASYRAPDSIATTSQVLAIPAKRMKRTLVSFLTGPEAEAFIAAPTAAAGSGDETGSCCTWASRPDSASVNSSGCVSTASRSARTANSNASARDASSASSRCRNTAQLLTAWLRELPTVADTPLFPTHAGTAMTRPQSRSSSPDTSRLWPRSPLLWAGRTSHPTRRGTPAR